MILFPGETLESLSFKQAEYRRFLDSEQWDHLRKECYRRAGYRCCRCKATNKTLNAHHKYYPEKFEQTTQDHLECLCRDCHEAHHNGKPKEIHQPEIRPMAITSFQHLIQLRSTQQINRAEFEHYRDKLRGYVSKSRRIKKPKKKRKPKGKKARLRAQRVSFKNSIRTFCTHPYMNWVKRGNSSN